MFLFFHFIILYANFGQFSLSEKLFRNGPELNAIRNECQEQFHLPANFVKIIEASEGIDDEFFKNHYVKCYVACLFHSLSSKDATVKDFDKIINVKNAEVFHGQWDECVYDSKSVKDSCEQSYFLLKCLSGKINDKNGVGVKNTGDRNKNVGYNNTEEVQNVKNSSNIATDKRNPQDTIIKKNGSEEDKQVDSKVIRKTANDEDIDNSKYVKHVDKEEKNDNSKLNEEGNAEERTEKNNLGVEEVTTPSDDEESTKFQVKETTDFKKQVYNKPYNQDRGFYNKN